MDDPKRHQIDDDFLMDEEDDDFDQDDDGFGMDCGLRRDGQCAMAGTEDCDFRCPNRDSEDFAGSAAWNRKHGTKGRRTR